MRLQKGFTLFELLAVLAIIGIITAIALPQYRDYTLRGKIPEATSGLSDLRVKMEQYFQDNRYYYTSPTTTGTCGVAMPATKAFSFGCVPHTATTYTITATGGLGTDKSMAGFVYTINETNTRRTTGLPAGWGTTPITCWVTKKGGQC